MEQELVNEIYIFAKPDEMGMKFYDRTPDRQIPGISALLSKGTFRTAAESISPARWEPKINGVNESRLIKTSNGSYTATTIIVSVEKMMEILESILVAEDQNDIIIDVRENKTKSEDISEEKKIK